MNLLVKNARGLYRLPVARAMDKDQFARFKAANAGVEALVFPLDRRMRPATMKMDGLEFVMMQTDDAAEVANYVGGKEN